MDDEKKTENTEQTTQQTNEQEQTVDTAQIQTQPKPKADSGKKVVIGFIAMGVVIIILLIVLIVVLLSGKKKDDPSSSDTDSSESSQTDSSTAGEVPGDSITDVSGVANDYSAKDDSSSKAETSADKLGKGLYLAYTEGNTWEDGDKKMCGLSLSIINNTDEDIKNWTLVLDVENLKSCSGWCGNFTVSGNTLTITNAPHNGEIKKGASITDVGCNIGTGGKLNIRSAKLNGKAMTVKAGKIDIGGGNNNNNTTTQQGEKKTDVSALLTRTKTAKQGDDWLHTDGNKILDKDGKQVWLTGVNWFGYNTGTNTFDGLWNSQLAPTVKSIADHGFNLIRVPISAELLLQWKKGEYPKANYNNAYNPALNDMNSLQIFDYFLKLAEENGMKVMPDIHSAETNASGHNVNLWYTDKISVDKYMEALEWMAERYKGNDTIIAYDLKNEPHGKPDEGKNAAIWNASKDANNWKYVAETAAAKVLAKNPNVLIMIEGTEIYPKNSKGDYSSTNKDDYYFNWWGGNLRAVRDFPIDLGKYQNKLVYSPHDYGPTVYEQPWFKSDYTFDSLMKDCWQDNWFYIHKENKAPLLIGEWGGFMKDPNLKWMTYMRKLIKDNHLNHTFWCFNANSGDTGGLVLDDFRTWDTEKYNFVKEVLWQQNGKFVGLDHAVKLGANGITLTEAKGL